MFGVNQAECCDGETIESCPAVTSDVAAAPRPVIELAPSSARSGVCSTEADGAKRAKQG